MSSYVQLLMELQSIGIGQGINSQQRVGDSCTPTLYLVHANHIHVPSPPSPPPYTTHTHTHTRMHTHTHTHAHTHTHTHTHKHTHTHTQTQYGFVFRILTKGRDYVFNAVSHAKRVCAFVVSVRAKRRHQ